MSLSTFRSKAYSIYAFLCLLIIMVLLSPFFLLVTVLKAPLAANLLLQVCNTWFHLWNWLTFIHYREIHLSASKEKQPYIYIANHRSYLDIVSTIRAVKCPVRILGRQDIARMPIIGYFYKKLVITVDRNDKTARARSILALNQCLEDGTSIFVFPEGTFNKSETPLTNFHDGAFLLALSTQTPIKPLLFLDNAARLHPDRPFTLSHGNCRVIFMDEISARGYQKATLKEFKQQVYDAMEGVLNEHCVIR
jgi:1-acyl-sn-glycerol-3-phosphate acyltransferase